MTRSRASARDQRQGVATVGRLDDLAVAQRRQQALQAGAHQGVVVHQQYVHRSLRLLAARWPAGGPARVQPPACATR